MVIAAYLAMICMAIACFTGVGLTTSFLIPKVAFPIHFCFAPLVLIATLFCLEHFLPLGQLPFLWVPWLGWVGFLVASSPTIRAHLFTSAMAYFCAGFFYCFFWRFCFPDICCLGDQLPDLGHLVSWSQGARLPAMDFMAPGERDVSFSILHYYAAGLIHRFMGTPPGLTYHLGYCFLTGVAAAAFGEGIRTGAGSRLAGSLSVAWLLMGGNGATFLVPFMARAPVNAHQAVAFCGAFSEGRNDNLTPFGQWIAHGIGTCEAQTTMNYFSCAIVAGDLSPALSSMTFLSLAILAIGMAHRAIPQSQTDRACVVLAVSTPVLLLVANTELAAFQAPLVLAWLCHRWFIGRRDFPLLILAPVIASFCFISPFLVKTAQAFSQAVYPPISDWHIAPLASWFIALFPAVIIWLLGLIFFVLALVKKVDRKETGRFLSNPAYFRIFALVSGVLALIAAELACGQVNQTPISYDAWPWIYALVVSLTLISISARTMRAAVLAILALTIVPNGYLMALEWYRPLFVKWPEAAGQKSHVGQLNGCAWLMDDPYGSCIFQVLSAQPKGTVLESSYWDPGNSRAAMGLFTGHPEALAFTQHEVLLRGVRSDLDRPPLVRDDFYLGHGKDVSWLDDCVPGGITYIVWQGRDNDRTLDAWPVINEELRGKYDWKSCSQYNKANWGFWVRRPESAEKEARP